MTLPFDPRDVAVADVYKAGQKAATLRREGGGIAFSYDDDYLARDAPAVATTLPVTDEPVRTFSGSLPPFFTGLLPEGRRLASLRAAVKTSADDELSLLVAVGEDPVGDVQVLPGGTEPGASKPTATTAESFDDMDFTALLESVGIDPSAIAGVQDKVSGRMITVPITHKDHAHFLKLTPPEFPFLVENEAYFLQVAHRLRQPVSTADVVYDRNGRSGLLVTRFDRTLDEAGRLRQLPVEDAAQLLGRYPADKYSVTSELLATRVGEVCAARPVALRNVFTQICFAWVTGNGDLHAKNISVIGTNGEWRVAPTYDIPSSLPYRDRTLALSVQGQRDGLSRNRMLAFANEIGLPARAAERSITDVLSATTNVLDDLEGNALPLDKQRTRELIRGIRSRRNSLIASGAR